MTTSVEAQIETARALGLALAKLVLMLEDPHAACRLPQDRFTFRLGWKQECSARPMSRDAVRYEIYAVPRAACPAMGERAPGGRTFEECEAYNAVHMAFDRAFNETWHAECPPCPLDEKAHGAAP